MWHLGMSGKFAYEWISFTGKPVCKHQITKHSSLLPHKISSCVYIFFFYVYWQNTLPAYVRQKWENKFNIKNNRTTTTGKQSVVLDFSQWRVKSKNELKNWTRVFQTSQIQISLQGKLWKKKVWFLKVFVNFAKQKSFFHTLSNI